MARVPQAVRDFARFVREYRRDERVDNEEMEQRRRIAAEYERQQIQIDEWVTVGQDFAAGVGDGIRYITGSAIGLNWEEADRLSGSYVTAGEQFEIHRTVVYDERRQFELNDLRLAVEQYRIRMQAESAEAVAKSRALLISFLSPEQEQELSKQGYITVVGSLDNLYRIYPHKNYNVKAYRKDTYPHRGDWIGLCAVPYGSFPIYDIMLTQMLALQTDEKAFVNMANREDAYHNHWGESTLRISQEWRESRVRRNSDGTFTIMED